MTFDTKTRNNFDNFSRQSTEGQSFRQLNRHTSPVAVINTRQSTPRTGKCYFCGRNGHYQMNCRDRVRLCEKNRDWVPKPPLQLETQ